MHDATRHPDRPLRWHHVGSVRCGDRHHATAGIHELRAPVPVKREHCSDREITPVGHNGHWKIFQPAHFYGERG
jgi:hypothetical protein